MAPTDQRAGVRPISFILDAGGGSLSDPVTLKVRPEDLTRTEPSRLTVHQTLGRGAQGWVDNFGEGLPSVAISGHTGWRAAGYNAQDGVQAFEHLNTLVMHSYHAAKQSAIDTGRDPAGVKLLFIDMLDGFSWSVAPTQFVLRRSKSRPLLMQYNITLQAVDTAIDRSSILAPFLGNVPDGLRALADAVGRIESFAGGIVGMINGAVSFVQGVVTDVARVVSGFVTLTKRVMGAVQSVVGAVVGGFTSITNSVIRIAKDISSAGVSIFRTFSAIRNLPAALKAQLGRVAAAYNEIACIFSNALRPRKVYQNYDGLYGASNCSSTTGGRPPSVYSNANPFALIKGEPSPITVSSSASSSMNAIIKSDPVLAPMPIAELERNIANVVTGVAIA